MILLHPKDENNYDSNGLGALDNWIVEGTVYWKLNGEYTLTFKYPLHEYLGMEIKNEMQVEIRLPNFSDVFRIKKTTKSMGFVECFCEHKSYDLIGNFIQDINIVEKTGQMAMDQISGGMTIPHPFILKSEIGEIRTARMVRLGGMQAITDDGIDNSFVSRWGGEFERHYNTITNKRKIGMNRNVKIEYGKDLVGYTAEIDTTGTVTRVVPIGFDGLMLPEKHVDSPLIDIGLPKIQLIKYEKVKAAIGDYKLDEDAVPLEDAYADLRKLAALEFSEKNIDKPKGTYNIDFVLLNETQEYENVAQLQNVQPGDYVEVHHYLDGFNVLSRVIEFTIDITTGRYEEMKLGDIQLSLVNEIATKRDITEAVNSNSSQTSAFLDDLRKDIEASWRNEDGFNYELKSGNPYGLPAGYYSFDRAIDDNPTSVIGISGGRLVIANRKDTSGNFIFTTFGTGDGLAADTVGADQIKANSITANEIASGAITAEKIAAGAITADKITMNSGLTVEQAFSETNNYIEGINKVYTELPRPPYRKNDVWMQKALTIAEVAILIPTLVTSNPWNLDLRARGGAASYVCVTDRQSGEFNLSDWKLVATDDLVNETLDKRIATAESSLTNTALNLTTITNQVSAIDGSVKTVQKNYTDVQAGLIDVVKKGDLSTPGRTTIDGGNVTTGSVRSSSGSTIIDLTKDSFSFANGMMTFDPMNGFQVGGWKITENGLSKKISKTFGPFTASDKQVISDHLAGIKVLDSAGIAKYDFLSRGYLTVSDGVRVSQMVDGLNGWTNPASMSQTLFMDPSDSMAFIKAIIVRDSDGKEFNQFSTKIGTALVKSYGGTFEQLTAGFIKTNGLLGITVDIKSSDGKIMHFENGILTSYK